MQRFFAFICAIAASVVAVAGGREVSPRASAAEIRQLLNSASRIELLSLEVRDAPRAAVEGDFHGYPVLGALTVTSPDERRTLVDQVTKSIARSPSRTFGCFLPRHGVRATLKDETVELLICFECSTVYYIRAGKQQRLNIDEKPEKFLNGLLQNAGIRLNEFARPHG